MSATAHLKIANNEDWSYTFVFKRRDGQRRDFTNYTFRLQIALASNPSSVIYTLDHSIVTPTRGIVHDDIATGKIVLRIPSGALNPGDYVHQLDVLTGSPTITRRIWSGTLTVEDGVG